MGAKDKHTLKFITVILYYLQYLGFFYKKYVFYLYWKYTTNNSVDDIFIVSTRLNGYTADGLQSILGSHWIRCVCISSDGGCKWMNGDISIFIIQVKTNIEVYIMEYHLELLEK